MLLLNEYTNIKVYDKPSTVQVGGQDIFFIPWITSESEQETLDSIRNTPARIAMGHLELSGFYINQGTYSSMEWIKGHSINLIKYSLDIII